MTAIWSTKRIVLSADNGVDENSRFVDRESECSRAGKENRKVATKSEPSPKPAKRSASVRTIEWIGFVFIHASESATNAIPTPSKRRSRATNPNNKYFEIAYVGRCSVDPNKYVE